MIVLWMYGKPQENAIYVEKSFYFYYKKTCFFIEKL